MTKHQMVHVIALKTGMEKQTVKQIVQMTLNAIVDSLKRKGRIELRDFGIFEARMLKARKCRNPKTGEVIFVSTRLKVFFKAGRIMSARLNGLRVAQQEAGHG